MIVDQNLPQKEIVEIETRLGGAYNVESVDNGDGTQTLNITTAEKAFDRLQWKCDNVKSLHAEFLRYTGDSLDEVLKGLDTSQVTDTASMFYDCSNLRTIPLFDTSKVTDMNYMFCKCPVTSVPLFDTKMVTNMFSMFYQCTKLTTIPLLDTRNVTNMSNMFYYCRALTAIPLLNTSKVTNMSAMFSNCTNLTTIPELDTSKVTSMSSMFAYCSNLTTIPLLDMIKTTSTATMFQSCTNLTNLTLKNIKVNLQIGYTTSYGHLLTLDSLINTIKELWDYSSGTKTYTLQMSTPSKELIANTYVKLITPTEEMIANDPYIESKMPCEVCESTDEGAMLLTDYATLKKWTIA